MTLSALIRKRDTGNLATAIPAISATDGQVSGEPVARIATVAVANPKTGVANEPAPIDPEAIEERAAIMEYDGGLSREEAEAMAHAIQTRRMRERGEVPAHYTATTTCKHCGPVPIFPGVPATVLGCPWCFNRVQGLPVPVKA